MLFNCGCWRRLLRVPWTPRRSNQSILKQISPEYTLEGLMMKMKLQYFGHLMLRADSFEKILMLGKTEGGRRRGQQRMRWLDGITDSMDMGFYKQEYLSGLPFPPPDFCLYSKIIQLNRIGQKLLLGFSITSYVHMHTFFFFPLDCLFYKDWIRVGENHK